jgi:hypothetical protein
MVSRSFGPVDIYRRTCLYPYTPRYPYSINSIALRSRSALMEHLLRLRTNDIGNFSTHPLQRVHATSWQIHEIYVPHPLPSDMVSRPSDSLALSISCRFAIYQTETEKTSASASRMIIQTLSRDFQLARNVTHGSSRPNAKSRSHGTPPETLSRGLCRCPSAAELQFCQPSRCSEIYLHIMSSICPFPHCLLLVLRLHHTSYSASQTRGWF